MSESNGKELYRKHRPKILKDVKGQDKAVRTLRQFIKNGNLPHALLLVGPSGTGKTTIARALQDEIGCSDMDFHEVDCPRLDKVGEAVKDIVDNTSLCAWGGKNQIWFLEEVQSLSRAPFAQQALLKALEDTPDHVYFILATTDPEKLIPAIKTRCTVIPLESLKDEILTTLVQEVAQKEKIEVTEDVVAKIVKYSDGSARKSLVFLQQVMHSGSEQDQLDRILNSDTQARGDSLASALVKRSPWSKIAKIIKENTDAPENLRRAVLGYATNSLLNREDERLYMILTAFESDFYNSGKAGLVRACYEVCRQK